jgi:hypothetical protein
MTAAERSALASRLVARTAAAAATSRTSHPEPFMVMVVMPE